jgi:hypothetical protein
VIDDGTPAVERLTAARRAYGLDRPYGPGAVELGLGAAGPVRAADADQITDPTEPPESTHDDELTPAGAVQPEHDAAHVELDELPAGPPFSEERRTCAS